MRSGEIVLGSFVLAEQERTVASELHPVTQPSSYYNNAGWLML